MSLLHLGAKRMLEKEKWKSEGGGESETESFDFKTSSSVFGLCFGSG